MPTKEILKFCIEKGLLIDREVLNLFDDVKDVNSAKIIIEKIKNYTHKRIITKEIFEKNKEKVIEFLSFLPEESKKSLEKLRINLGISIEISREVISKEENSKQIKEENENQIVPVMDIQTQPIQKIQAIQNEQKENCSFAKETILVNNEKSFSNAKINSCFSSLNRAIEVKDFANYFRNRYLEMKNILQEHTQLNNLVSINKISGNRQGISIIGIVYSKTVTKNNNIIFEVEDLTGRIKVLVGINKPEVYELAQEIPLDSIIGFKGTGSREILFANEIIIADLALSERKKSNTDEYAAFIADLHFGSKLCYKESFLKFIDYLNCKMSYTSEAEKIKYLFIVGDIVTGVGNYPEQEKDLEIVDLEEQFIKLAEILGKIRKDITIIISPGNHDGVRIMEPQPIFDEKYAWPLYRLENVLLVPNPSVVNIGAGKNFSGFNVLLYHGFSFKYYADNIPSLIKSKAIHNPEILMTYLLKNRHLAPTHGSTQYSPDERDCLLIREAPDIFLAGHLHKSAVAYYNNILLVSSSTWEKMTPYMEKVGAQPDFCKVPIFNLKTRAIKILDFEE